MTNLLFHLKAVKKGTHKAQVGAGAETFLKSEPELEPNQIVSAPQPWIAGSPQGSPPAADYVGCEAGRRTRIKHETGTEELCEIK
jgi:hypothetical protein